jgi:hypothetical protein
VKPIKNKISAPFILAALFFVVLAVIAGARSYSPTPYWDMWNGYLGFYIDVMDGKAGAWWAQHNEHRIFLSRIFFWLDLALFSGRGYLLIILNYALSAASCIFFSLIICEKTPQDNQQTLRWVLISMVFILLFAWPQEENLTWGFQSQMIFAQLLPLAGFYLLHRASGETAHNKAFFIAAAACGVAAIGSMANGVIALPLMVLLAMALRMKWQRIAILGALSAICLAAYFIDYKSPENHISIVGTLAKSPLSMANYFFAYMGGIISYLWEKNITASFIGGLVLLASALFFSWRTFRAWRRKESVSLDLALLSFLLYFGGTALGTAGGRALFGAEQALDTRYQTPVFMAWSALLVLCVPFMTRQSRSAQAWVYVPLAVVVGLLVPGQIKLFDDRSGVLFERKLAALALELDIRDASQVALVFPDDRVYPVARIASRRNYSVFDDAAIADANFALGKTEGLAASPVSCNLVLESLTTDAFPRSGGSDTYVRVNGYAFQATSRKSPQVLHVLDPERRIVGYGLSGRPRPDMVQKHDLADKAPGFTFYLPRDQVGSPLIIRGLDPDCESTVQGWATPPAQLAYRILDIAPSGDNVRRAVTDSVVKSREWLGKDSYSIGMKQDTLPDAVILGSWAFPLGDANRGEVTLHLKRGNIVWFRSDSNSGGQKLVVRGGSQAYVQKAPHAPNWIALEFSHPKLPDEFDVSFIDTADGVGEWMALGFRR